MGRLQCGRRPVEREGAEIKKGKKNEVDYLNSNYNSGNDRNYKQNKSKKSNQNI